MPMRKRICRPSGTALVIMPSDRWTASAAVTAPVAVSKTASTESPAMSITRPWLASMRSRNIPRAASSADTVARSSAAIRRE
jgi:hypothetical protein